ncbi:MAG: F0F1 ATP synthase subunit B [Euzebyales bacterium]|jgi:F-type H+-transporting ATPase subunit b|nr:F0F1 ATP synthase subunit B [Euzebyales bacterium]
MHLPFILAVEGAEAELQLLPDVAELIWGFVAFSLLMAFMFWKVFPRMNTAFDERGAKIQGQIEEAERLRVEAEQLRRSYEEQLADARGEANTIVEDAKAQAERLKADIVARAEQEAQQITARARDDIETDRTRLVSELRGQVATLSVELAGKIVQRELDESQHRALVDQYINELSGLN